MCCSSGKEVKLRKSKPIKDEEERGSQLFITESKSAFKKYQVVYLRGASVPTKYADLLPCSNDTSHDQVIWCDQKPSNTLFSINQLKLSDEELNLQKQEVKCALTDITTRYIMEHSHSDADIV